MPRSPTCLSFKETCLKVLILFSHPPQLRELRGSWPRGCSVPRRPCSCLRGRHSHGCGSREGLDWDSSARQQSWKVYFSIWKCNFNVVPNSISVPSGVSVSVRVTSPTTWLAPTVPSNTQFALRAKLAPRQQKSGINCFMLIKRSNGVNWSVFLMICIPCSADMHNCCC